MKALNLLLLALLFAGTAFAQSPSQPTSTNQSPIEITQVSWRREVFIPALYEDPMRINQDQRELERDKKATIVENRERARQGEAPLPIPTKKIAAGVPVGSTPMGTAIGDEPAGNQNAPVQSEPGAASARFIYEAKIKNNGEKTISAIFWTYSLIDKETQAVVGRHRFKTKVTIRPGKTSSLTGRSKNPPAAVINASKSSKAADTRHGEFVTIDRIEYSDETFWEPPAPGSTPSGQQ